MQDKKVSKPKLKVCYIITKGVWGGAQKYVYTLATNLPKDKFDVSVIFGKGNILKHKLIERGIRVYELDSLKRDIGIVSEIKSLFYLYKIIKKESPDILHLNSPKASGMGALIGRMLLIPKIIQTVHGWTFNEKRNIFSKILIYLVSWVTLLLTTKTIVIAKKEKKQALRMPFVKDQRIALIKNGIENIKFREKKIVRQALLDRVHAKGLPRPNLSENTTWIGTISELHKNKGLRFIINALAKVEKPFVFFVIGEGEERANLESLIRERDLRDKVFLVGFIDIANLYLKAFDIFTLTSIKEGLPYTILEAGNASLPVLASDIGGIPDIIDDGKNGILVRKGSTEQIKDTIDFLIDNKEKRIEFGKKLKEKVSKEFSVDGMIKKTTSLYR